MLAMTPWLITVAEEQVDAAEGPCPTASGAAHPAPGLSGRGMKAMEAKCRNGTQLPLRRSIIDCPPAVALPKPHCCPHRLSHTAECHPFPTLTREFSQQTAPGAAGAGHAAARQTIYQEMMPLIEIHIIAKSCQSRRDKSPRSGDKESPKLNLARSLSRQGTERISLPPEPQIRQREGIN
ncbi:hypothetical protein AOLI_G00322130 [Acnodon oligacanthus]